MGMTPGSIKVARVKLDTTKVVITIWTITMEKWYRSIRSRHLCMCLLSKGRETTSVHEAGQAPDLRIVKEYTGRKDEDGPGDGGRNQFGYLFTRLGHNAASDVGADRLLERPLRPSPPVLCLLLFRNTLQSGVLLIHVAAMRCRSQVGWQERGKERNRCLESEGKSVVLPSTSRIDSPLVARFSPPPASSDRLTDSTTTATSPEPTLTRRNITSLVPFSSQLSCPTHEGCDHHHRQSS